MSQFVEFSIPSPERFTALQRVFAALKHDKDTGNWRPNEELLAFFDTESLGHFFWPTDDVRRQRLEDLRTRPVIETPTEQSTGRTWDFDSLIDAFVNGEYNLIGCEMTENGKARLTFDAFAYPYGGVGCMVALVEVFGGIITGIDDGTGFVDMSFESEIVTLLEQGRKLEAIKLYRAKTGLGLKEAKDFVESLAADRRIVIPSRSGCLGVVLFLTVIFFLLVAY